MSDNASNAINLHASNKGVNASVSQAGMETFERVWGKTLDWSHENPISFLALLALVAFTIVQLRLARRERRSQMEEYRSKRERSRKPRDLPPPDFKH